MTLSLSAYVCAFFYGMMAILSKDRESEFRRSVIGLLWLIVGLVTSWR